jgi:hypothetical protein
MARITESPDVAWALTDQVAPGASGLWGADVLKVMLWAVGAALLTKKLQVPVAPAYVEVAAALAST